MTQALVKAPAREQSRLAAISGFTDAEIALMEQTVAPGATRLELAFFLVNAARLGLDPILKQIYFIKYSKDKPAEIVIGIDGYRARAEGTGLYAGSDDPEFEYDDVGQPEGGLERWPSKATVTVWKIVAGQRVPFTASARWLEFYPGEGKQGDQYRKRPHNQLAIRAESHALRKAFPQQTAALDVRVEPPQEWVDAVESDAQRRDDPEATRRNAKRYDEIFGPEDQALPSAPAAPPRGHARPRAAAEPSSPPPSRRALLEENKRLVAKARELGVEGVPPIIAPGDGDNAIATANADLAERIRVTEQALADQSATDDEEGQAAQGELV